MMFDFSAGAIIYKKENGRIKFLFLISHKNELDIPKGHFENNETAMETAKREIKEETGLDVEFLPYFKYVNRYFFSEGKERVLKRVATFISKVSENATIKISSEHKGYVWLGYEKAMERMKYKDMKQLLTIAYDYIKRYEAMEELNKKYKQLSKLRGWSLGKRFVPGEGPLNAKAMLLGQAPGKVEDQMLRPFVGRSGRLLDEMLKKAMLSREDFYITSVVQFFPPKNREPTKKEVELCKPFLEKEIEIVKPKFIILLGRVAAEAMLGIENIEANHGKKINRGGITYFITYHPAAALRFPKTRKRMEADLKKFCRIIKKKER
ncbi:MAG: uracil-DNA glycosylase family protein [Candidatus Micrarchaeia archaeon]